VAAKGGETTAAGVGIGDVVGEGGAAAAAEGAGGGGVHELAYGEVMFYGQALEGRTLAD
jgi:hypothetical protein